MNQGYGYYGQWVRVTTDKHTNTDAAVGRLGLIIDATEYRDGYYVVRFYSPTGFSLGSEVLYDEEIEEAEDSLTEEERRYCLLCTTIELLSGQAARDVAQTLVWAAQSQLEQARERIDTFAKTLTRLEGQEAKQDG
jgi:hypothetical protein